MANFEDIVRESARNSIRMENSRLHVPCNPMQQRRAHWGWVATPVAAVVGVVMGMSLQNISDSVDSKLSQVADTIRVTEQHRDTVFLTQIERERIVLYDTFYIARPVATDATLQSSTPQAQPDQPLCTSIQCDGINYSLLVAN